MKDSQTKLHSGNPNTKTPADLASPKESAILAVLFTLSAALIPFLLWSSASTTLSLTLSVAAIVLSIALQVRLVGSVSGALGHIVLLLSLAFLGASPLLAALLGLLISSACAFAQLCLKRHALWLVALPLLSYAVALAVLRAPLGAASALLPLPSALILWASVKKKQERLPSICSLAAAFSLTLLTAGALALWHSEAGLSVETIRAWLDSVRAGVTGELINSADLLGEELGYAPDAAQIGTIIDTLFNVLPALFLILCALVGWMLHTAMLRIEVERGLSKEDATAMLSFDMSMTSAIVYFLALFLSWALAADGVGFWGTLASNVCLVLVPGMLMTAWIALNALLFGRAPSCFSLLLYLLILFLIFQFPAVMLPIAAAFGAGVVLVGRIRRYLTSK